MGDVVGGADGYSEVVGVVLGELVRDTDGVSTGFSVGFSVVGFELG